MKTTETAVKSILTRTSGYLTDVCSHSLQPYRGCPFGAMLCGVSCYVQHNVYATRGEPWGSFLDVRTNAAEAYLAAYERERSWARSKRDRFVIFLSSATEPFPPQERRFGVTGRVLDAMLERPPDGLIVQTHSHHVTEAIDRLVPLAERCQLRVHVSIETDRDRLPGLPPHASTVEKRFEAAQMLRHHGGHDPSSEYQEERRSSHKTNPIPHHKRFCSRNFRHNDGCAPMRTEGRRDAMQMPGSTV